jgi:hypothetical protein
MPIKKAALTPLKIGSSLDCLPPLLMPDEEEVYP